jgi:predicted permease
MTNVLLVAQVALTLVLLVGAGLMMRSFVNSQRFDVGIDTANLMTVQVQPPEARYPQPADRLAFQERLMERLRSIPGIGRVTIASQPPASGAQGRTLSIAGHRLTDANNRLPVVGRIAVLADYFDTLDVKIRGRNFTAADGAPGAEVAIVNEPFVTRYFSGGDVIGKQIRLGQDFERGIENPKDPLMTIIGVSPAILQQNGPNANEIRVQPAVYVPFRQEPTIAFTVLARSRLARESLIASLRNELRNVDPDIPLYNIRTMDEIIERRTWPFFVFGSLFAVFALIAIILSSVGIYAVTSYGVGQRTQEIGVRMALGASESDVMWLVLRQGLRRIGIGIAIGLLAAWGLARVLASLLVEVPPDDPMTFGSITILLAVVTLVACLVPARRAMRLDPVDSLRSE